MRERAQRSQDITAEAVSARSRLTDARTERKSLLRAARPRRSRTPETESIRARLQLVSARDRAGARRACAASATGPRSRPSRSTLVADRSARPPATEDDSGWTPGDAARDALRVLEVAAGVALIVLALAVPLALLALLAALARALARRRRREHALDAV